MKIRNFLAACLAVLTMAAAPYTPLQSISNVATLAAGNFKSLPQITLQGYYAPGDGGEGALSYSAAPCTEDGGYCFHDGAGNSFTRNNLNGALAQYGITLGSAYDWSVHGVSATDATPIIEAAQTANALAGVPTTHCGAMQIYLATSLVLAANSSFTCDVNASITNNSTGYINIPGTIRLAHGATITRAGDGSSIYGAYVLPSWYTTAPANAQTGFAALASMVSNGDTGIICNQQSCDDHDLTIIGFDTGYEAINSPDLTTDNISVDANVCYWFSTTGGSTVNSNDGCFTYLTRSIPNSVRTQDFRVTSVTNDGGLCKVAVSATGPNLVTDLQFANYVFIARLTSTSASCNGEWKISNLSVGSGTATFDLVGSSVLGMVGGNAPFGNWTAGQNIVYLSDLTNVAPGNVINGLDAQGIPTGTTVSYIWGIPKITIGFTAGTGSANTYAVNSGTNAPCALADGVNSYWTPPASNTGASTLNVSLNTDPNCSGGTTGALPIVRPDGSALLANDLVANKHAWVIYSAALSSWVLHKPKIILSTNTTLAQTTPFAVPLTNTTCSPCGTNPDAIISTAIRIDAGGSAGGVAAGGLMQATGFLIGGPSSKDLSSSNKTAGMSCLTCSVFDHSNFIHIQNSNETSFTDLHTDSQGETDARSEVILLVDGQVNNAHISGTKATKGGTAILINSAYPNAPDRGCVTWDGASVASSAGTFPVVDIEQGCWRMLSGLTNSTGVNFIANTALQARFDVYMPNVTNIFEGDAAASVTWTVGSSIAGGNTNANLITSTITAITAAGPTTVTPNFVFWPCNATSNDVTFTLPDATLYKNYNFQFKKTDSSSHNCIINPPGGQTIDGRAHFYLSGQYDRLAVTSDGSAIWSTQ